MDQISLKSPGAKALERLILGERQYAQLMNQYRPSDREVETGVEIPLVSQLRLTEQYSWVTFNQLQTSNRKLPAPRRKQVQKQLLARDFNVPNMRMRRTPGQPFEGVRMSYLHLNYQTFTAEYVHHDFFSDDKNVTIDPEALADMEKDVRHGWNLRPLALDEIPNIGRYEHWLKIHKAGKLINEPIPKIKFLKEPHPKSLQHLYYCLDQINSKWRSDRDEKWKTVRYLFQWLLWSHGHPSVPDFPECHWNDRAHDILYQVFDASWLLMKPYDYFGHLLEELSDLSFPIPKQISMERAIELAAELFPNPYQDGSIGKGFLVSDYRQSTLVDLETGSGRILLAASNYCNGLIGTNSNDLLSQAAILNLYFYVPNRIFPHPFLDFDNSAKAVMDSQSRAFTIAKEKGIDVDQYFATTEPTPDAKQFQPIRQRRKKRDAPAKPKAQLPSKTLALPGAETPSSSNLLDDLWD